MLRADTAEGPRHNAYLKQRKKYSGISAQTLVQVREYARIFKYASAQDTLIASH